MMIVVIMMVTTTTTMMIVIVIIMMVTMTAMTDGVIGLPNQTKCSQTRDALNNSHFCLEMDRVPADIPWD